MLSVLPLKLYGASCGVHVSTRLNIWQFIGRCHGPAKACEKWCQCEHGSLHSNLQHRRVVLGKHSCVFEHHVSCTRRAHNRRAATKYSCCSLLGPAAAGGEVIWEKKRQLRLPHVRAGAGLHNNVNIRSRGPNNEFGRPRNCQWGALAPERARQVSHVTEGMESMTCAHCHEPLSPGVICY